MNSANRSNPSFLHLLSQRYSQRCSDKYCWWTPPRQTLCFNDLQVYSINWVWAPVTGLTNFWLWFSQMIISEIEKIIIKSQIHMWNITNCHLNCQDRTRNSSLSIHRSARWYQKQCAFELFFSIRQCLVCFPYRFQFLVHELSCQSFQQSKHQPPIFLWYFNLPILASSTWIIWVSPPIFPWFLNVWFRSIMQTFLQ